MTRSLWLALILLASFCRPAFSQEATVRGPGYELGDGAVFHPHVGVEMGVISNVFFEDTEEQSGTVLRLLAGFDVESVTSAGRNSSKPGRTLGQDFGRAGDTEGGAGGVGRGRKAIDWSVGLQLRYDEYLSSDEVLKSQRDLGVHANGRLVVSPEGQLQLIARDEFIRESRSPNFETSGNLDRNINRLTLDLAWRPKASTLAATLRYRNIIDRFEDSELAFANRMQHEVQARADWRFLPLTLFYASATQGVYRQLDTGEPDFTDSVSSNPLDLRVGANSAITPLTTVKVFAGWGWGFYDGSTASYSSPIYGVDLGYRYSPLGRIVVAATRRFEDSINANYYADYAFQAKLNQQMGAFLVSTGAQLIFRRYEGLPDSITTEEVREDTILELTAGAMFHYSDWLALVADYSLRSVTTDFAYEIQPGLNDDPGYTRHEIFGGARAAF